ncbi:MAG TPA: hypothetical protein VMR77_04085 [Patescibacteria group bacterium]|jgi:hypothetical protein|nr:hypothetical protein [Patescibacteria group bacterium]
MPDSERVKKSIEQRRREDEAVRAFVLEFIGEFVGPDKRIKPPTEGHYVCSETEEGVEGPEGEVIRKIAFFQTTTLANVHISQPDWTISATTHDFAVQPVRPSIMLCRDGQTNLYGFDALAKARELLG